MATNAPLNGEGLRYSSSRGQRSPRGRGLPDIGRGLRLSAARLQHWSRSMLGQMLLATALFVAAGVYVVAVRPMLTIQTLSVPDPMDFTMERAERAIQSALFEPDGSSGTLRGLSIDPVLREVAQHNPDFRYYAISGENRAGNVAEPVYYRAAKLDRATALRRELTGETTCIQSERLVTDRRGRGYLSYSNCGTERYVELSGIRHPIAVRMPGRLESYATWAWTYSQGFVVPATGVFAIIVAILVFNVLRIRRVARLTEAMHADAPYGALPEAGLPNEVLPLVRAVNGMIAQLDEAETRRRFFLSAAAHEMRTPLTVLRTRLEIMDDGPLKIKLIRDLGRLITLSNDLLTLMSITSKDRPAEPVDLAVACRNVLATLKPMAAAAGVTLSLATPRDGPVTAADAALVEVALTNYVVNAVAFSPAGEDVSVTVEDSGRIAVRDHGSGVQVADPGALFEPFVRSSGRHPGHGLGLAIVKAIADRHGATLEAGNAPDGGAVFAIKFQLLEDA